MLAGFESASRASRSLCKLDLACHGLTCLAITSSLPEQSVEYSFQVNYAIVISPNLSGTPGCAPAAPKQFGHSCSQVLPQPRSDDVVPLIWLANYMHDRLCVRPRGGRIGRRESARFSDRSHHACRFLAGLLCRRWSVAWVRVPARRLAVDRF